MSEFKPKRLITHKELDKAVDVRQLRNGHTGIPIYNLVIYVYYNKGTKPLETGHSGYTQVRNADEMPEELQNRNIIWGINLGKWLENILSKGILPRKPNNVTKEDWVQAVWDGNTNVLGVPQLALTQAQKKEVKNVLYKYINRNGTVALYDQEELLKQEGNNTDENKYKEQLRLLIEIGMGDVNTDIHNYLNVFGETRDIDVDVEVKLPEGLTVNQLEGVLQAVTEIIEKLDRG